MLVVVGLVHRIDQAHGACLVEDSLFRQRQLDSLGQFQDKRNAPTEQDGDNRDFHRVDEPFLAEAAKQFAATEQPDASTRFLSKRLDNFLPVVPVGARLALGEMFTFIGYPGGAPLRSRDRDALSATAEDQPPQVAALERVAPAQSREAREVVVVGVDLGLVLDGQRGDVGIGDEIRPYGRGHQHVAEDRDVLRARVQGCDTG